MKLAFITSTPTNVREGSGTWNGIRTLGEELKRQGHTVDLFSPPIAAGDLTSQRIAFNAGLRGDRLKGYDATIGFDLDGYSHAASARRPLHVASIKGVIADEATHETGAVKAGLEAQARLEAQHLRKADGVITTSAYSAGRLREMYKHEGPIEVVPELIDLTAWRKHAVPPPDRAPGTFRVLCICRLYPRKRVGRLLEAAALLRGKIPGLEVHIVGDGPEEAVLKEQHAKLGLGDIVKWRGFVETAALVAEYAGCDVFCLPSIQEGFGIVFLEAMASGKAIVATRAAAIPEVVRGGILVEPDNAAALAEAIQQLANDPARRKSLGEEGLRAVESWDAPSVARQFLAAVDTIRARRR